MVTLVSTVSTTDCDSVRMGSNPIRCAKHLLLAQPEHDLDGGLLRWMFIGFLAHQVRANDS